MTDVLAVRWEEDPPPICALLDRGGETGEALLAAIEGALAELGAGQVCSYWISKGS